MLHAFIDESEHRDKYFILTALVVTDENLPYLERELDLLVVKYATTTKQVRLGAELHGYDLMQQKRDWSGVPLNMATSIYLKALGIIEKWASALFVETIDRHAQAARYRNPWNARSIAIGYILERVNGYANLQKDMVNCYLDDHYTAPAGRKEFVQYKAAGTFGYKSSKLAYVKELEFYDSRSHRGLQAADLCCYVYQRRLTVTNGSKKMLSTQEKMWGAISGIAGTGRQGLRDISCG